MTEERCECILFEPADVDEAGEPEIPELWPCETCGHLQDEHGNGLDLEVGHECLVGR